MGYYRHKYVPQYIPGDYTFDHKTRSTLARSWDRLLSLSWQALDLDVSTAALWARRYRAPCALSPWYRSMLYQGSFYPYYAADRRYFHYDPTWYYYPRYRPFPLYHLNYPYWPWTIGGGRSGVSRYYYVRQPLWYSGSRLANALITEPPVRRYPMARGSLGDDTDVVVVTSHRKVRSYDDGPVDISTAAHKAQRITSHTADDLDTIQSKSKRQDQALLSDISNRLAYFQSPLIVPNRHVRILPVSWSPHRPIVLTDFVQRPHRRARASSLPPSLERPTKVEIDDPEVSKAFSLGVDLHKYKRYTPDFYPTHDSHHYSPSQDLSVRQAKRHLNKLERELGLDVYPGGEVVVPTRVTKVGEVVVRGHTGGGGGTHSYHHVSTRVSGGSGGGVDSYSLPVSAHSLGSSALAGSAGGYGGAGLGRAGAGLHTPSYHRIPMSVYERSPPHYYQHYIDELFPRKLEGLDLAGYVPGGFPIHHLMKLAPPRSRRAVSPIQIDSPVLTRRYSPLGRLPRETRASSMPVGAGAPPVEHFKGTPRHWEPAKAREVPAGNFTASRPPRHVEPPLSDVRRRARDVICKTRNDPNYYNF